MPAVILPKIEIHYIRIIPKYPDSTYQKKNPVWSLQGRVFNKTDMVKIKDLLKKPKLEKVEPDVEEGEKGYFQAYWKFNLAKKSLKNEETKEPSEPVLCIDGHKNPVDPATVGSGSIANIRVWQYPYGDEGEKTANMLTGIQLLKHVVRVQKPFDKSDGFEEAETEVVDTGENSFEGTSGDTESDENVY